jgi:hypothetical protein
LGTKFTGSQGESASFIGAYNHTYVFQASKDGYCGVSGVVNTNTSATKYLDLYLKYGACAGVTPTHTPIPNSTITPTLTMIGGYGNISGNATRCGVLPQNATPIDNIKNAVACLGITDVLGQNLVLALIIMLLIGFIAASKAGAIGFIIGVIIGALIATAMGLLAIWFIVLIVLCAIAVLALKIFVSSGG